MNKPKFDPNLPFTLETNTKPKFDANKKFETVQEDVSAFESLGRGLAQGVSFGFADEITGGLESLLTDKTYEQARDESRANYKIASDLNPVEYGIGEVGGAVGTAFIPGFGWLNAGKGAGLAMTAGKAALQGGIAAAGLSEADNTQDLIRDTATGAAISGAIGGATKLAAPHVSRAVDAVGDYTGLNSGKGVAQRIGKFMGVDADSVGKYYDNPEAFKDPKSLEQIKNQIDDVVTKGRKYTNKYEGIVQNTKDDINSIVADNLDEINNLRRSNPSVNVIDNIGEAISDLKQKVSKESGEAFRVLDETKVKLPKQPIEKLYKEALDMMKVAGADPVGDVVNKEFKSLINEAVRAKALPDELPLNYVKRLIQDLDASIEYSEKYGDFSSIGNKARQHIREGIDSILKTVSPEYKSVMEELKPQVDLLRNLNKRFGTDKQIFDRVSTMHSNRNKSDYDMLQELFSTANRKYDVSDELQDFINYKRIGPKEAKELAYGRPYYPNPSEPVYIPGVRTIDESLLQEKTHDLYQIQEAVDSFDINPERTESLIKDYLTKGKEGMNIENRKKLEALTYFDNTTVPTEEFGMGETYKPFKEVEKRNVSQDMFDDLEKLRVNEAFNKDLTRGSRNVNLFGILGAGTAVGAGGVGTAVGGPVGGLIGAGVGALGGAAVDKYGGRMLKGGIDFINYVNNTAVSQKLGKYAPVLIEAAKRGNHSLGATHFILQQTQPEYRQALKELEESED